MLFAYINKFFFWFVLCCFLAFFFQEQCKSQEQDSTKKKLFDTLQLSNRIDTSTKQHPNYHEKSPMGAVLRSLVLPGWGQLYNESYWKAPIFTAGAGLCLFLVFDNNKKFLDEKDLISNLDPTAANYSTLLTYHKKRREVFHDNRDQSGFALLAVYIIAAVDAYTGAHLFNFNVSDDLSLSVQPSVKNSQAYLGLCLNW